jgi:hypothetical protein
MLLIATALGLRTKLDCSELPHELTCSLNFSGPADSVVEAAVQHAVASHGQEDSEALRASLREALRIDFPSGRL